MDGGQRKDGRSPSQWAFSGVGVALGGGLGIAVGVAIAGGAGIATGVALGAAAGLLVGAAVDAFRSPRRRGGRAS